jgi:hypothetical protein
MQYGTAIAYLNHSLEFSTRILTRTNPTLTAVSWQIKIMEQNMKALWATIANEVAPPMITLANLFSDFAKSAAWAAQQMKNQLPIWYQLWDAAMRMKMGAPGVPVSINRLPSSSWEKMGLVLGQGGGNDYQKKTADATSKAVVILAKILLKMAPGRGQTPALNPQFSQF